MVHWLGLHALHCRGHRFDSWFGDQDSAWHRAVAKKQNKTKKLDTEQWVNILIVQVGTRKMEKKGKERQEERGKV